jgi:hypothetical protein
MSRKIYRLERPQDIYLRDYLKKANEWLSDLNFLGGELQYFEKILELHFTDIDTRTHEAGAVKTQLRLLVLTWEFTRAEVINHREALDLLLKDLITLEEDLIRDQHETLQVKIIGLEQSFKMFKTDFFRRTEKVSDPKSNEHSQ